jgi:hypothetical protein
MSGLKIGFIPDTQIIPGIPLDYMRWAGEFCADKEVDGVMFAGDVGDMQSLSSYSSKLEVEGRRYKEDVEAYHAGLDAFMGAVLLRQNEQRVNGLEMWKPWVMLTLGNHEYRVQRYVNDHPEMVGQMGMGDFNRGDIEVVPFLEVVEIGGVLFSHYFQNQKASRPIGGMMETRIKNIGHGFVAGHEQGRKFGTFDTALGRRDGLVAGSYYPHDEGYRGPQANGEWRGIVVLHEVKDGTFDPMFVSIQWLCGRYQGMLWSEYRREHGLG